MKMNIIITVQYIDKNIYCGFTASMPNDPKVGSAPGCQCCKYPILGKTDDGKVIPGVYRSHCAESSCARRD